MNAREVMQVLLSGGSVRRPSWQEGSYLFLDSDGKIKHQGQKKWQEHSIANYGDYEVHQQGCSTK